LSIAPQEIAAVSSRSRRSPDGDDVKVTRLIVLLISLRQSPQLILSPLDSFLDLYANPVRKGTAIYPRQDFNIVYE